MRRHAAGLALVMVLAVAPPAATGSAQGPVPGENDDAPIRIEVQVGAVWSIPAAGVQSYSSSGSLLEIAYDATKNTLDVHLVRAGSAALLLIRSDGTQRRYLFVAR